MKCATCKHWIRETNGYDNHIKLGLGTCSATLRFWDATEWDEEGDGRVFTEAGKKGMAFTQDGSDYKAWLYTRPEFGCVSHEEAPNAENHRQADGLPADCPSGLES